MPYVVIEAAAAGIPMIAANVGGIPEIFDTHTSALFAPGNVGAMADAIEARARRSRGRRWRAQNRCASASSTHFSQKAMVEGVLAGYRDAFAKR